jgi:hypothetical protein
LIGGRQAAATFLAAFGEAVGVEFSYRLDGGTWSSWSALNSWFGVGLGDGAHVFEVRSRDRLGNVDATPASAHFEIDATPPAPSIASPVTGVPVRGHAEIRGTASDARLVDYEVEFRRHGSSSWAEPEATVLVRSSIQVTSGTLATWDTSGLPDGLYDLRLAVTDSLGLTGATSITVTVDNQFPYAEETAPAVVTSNAGGDLYTTNQELHLYFPPHAFVEDALVTITPTGSATDTLPSGAVQVLPGYEITWSAANLQKPATLEFSTVGMAPVPGSLAIYSSPDGTSWHRLGGTRESEKVSLIFQDAGRYALFAESSVPEGAGSLSALSFTPRVFSPTGAFASQAVGISFTLGRAAPVTVRVYSRSGRLIREVVAGQAMNAGANLVRWDGRDRNGGYAADGMYLVTVEALGKTERKTLAVVK